MQKTEKKQGLIAGISLIIMAVVAAFSYGYVFNSLIADSPGTTLHNLIVGKSLFIAGLWGWIIIFITDLIVTLALYRFFLSTAKQASLVTALFRFTYTVFLGVAIFQLVKIIPMLNQAGSIEKKSVADEVTSRIELFRKIWSLGLIIFGLHLIGLGYLSVKSRFVSGILGYLLYLSGVSYIFVHGAKQFFLFDPVVMTRVENFLSLPMALGEMLLAVWLIYSGFRKD